MTVTPSVHKAVCIVSMTFSVIAGMFCLAGLFLAFTDVIYLLGMVLVGAVLQLVGAVLALIAGALNVVPELGTDHA